jgi:AAA domain
MTVTPADLNGHSEAPEALLDRAAKAAPPHPNGNSPPTATSSSKASGRRLRVTRIADVRAERVRWLWEDRLPLGMLSIIAGEPGLGKSTLTADVAARASQGELDGALRGQPCDALIVTFEDHVASVVRPRLEAAGADLDRVSFIEAVEEDGSEGLVSLPDDIDRIAVEVEGTAAKLLIIDPVVAALPANINAHRDQDVRRALAPLSKLAEHRDIAVIAVMHVNKAQASSLFQRIGGSVAFTGAARSALLVARDPDDPEGERGYRRVIAHGKSNVGRYAPSLSFEIESDPVGAGVGVATSRIKWLGESDATSSDLLGALGGDFERSALDDACQFLRAELADGPKEGKALKNAAGGAGISTRTLERAKADCGIVCKPFNGIGTPWYWGLPESDWSNALESAKPLDGLKSANPLADSENPAPVSGKVGIENVESAKSPRLADSGDLGAFAEHQPAQERPTDCPHDSHAREWYPHPHTRRIVCGICHPPGRPSASATGAGAASPDHETEGDRKAPDAGGTR